MGRRATVPPEQYLRKVAAEVSLHAEVASTSPAVCPMHAAYEDDQAVYMVLELCDGGGSLLQASWLQGGCVSERAVARAARSILEATAACHARSIVFRDIKPENFLLCEDGRVVLSDFGQATRVPEGGAGGAGPLSERCGTLPYLAPEVVRRSYGLEADCWSCGVVLYQLLAGRLPFTDEESEGSPTFKGMARSILYQPLDLESPPWDGVSVAAKHLVRGLLERDPRRRLTAAEALDHYWVREGGVAPDLPLGAADAGRGALERYATAGALRQALLRQTAALVPDDAPELSALREVFDALDPEKAGAVRVQDLAVVLDGLEGRGGGSFGDGAGLDLQGDLLRRSFRSQEALVFSEFVAAFADWTALCGDGRVEEWSARALKECGGSVAAVDLASIACAGAEAGSEAEECEADFEAAFHLADHDHNGRLNLQEWLLALEPPP